jgi:hypothetical protein
VEIRITSRVGQKGIHVFVRLVAEISYSPLQPSCIARCSCLRPRVTPCLYQRYYVSHSWAGLSLGAQLTHTFSRLTSSRGYILSITPLSSKLQKIHITHSIPESIWASQCAICHRYACFAHQNTHSSPFGHTKPFGSCFSRHVPCSE